MSFSNQLLCFSFVAALFSVLSTGYASEMVDKVCAQARRTDFCTSVLNSDPRSASASVAELGNIASELTSANVTATEAYIVTLLNGASEPKLRTALSGCRQDYADLISALENIADNLNSKNYTQVSYLVTGAEDAAIQCEELFSVPPPPINSPLTQRNNDAEDLVDIIGSVAYVLLKS